MLIEPVSAVGAAVKAAAAAALGLLPPSEAAFCATEDWTWACCRASGKGAGSVCFPGTAAGLSAYSPGFTAVDTSAEAGFWGRSASFAPALLLALHAQQVVVSQHVQREKTLSESVGNAVLCPTCNTHPASKGGLQDCHSHTGASCLLRNSGSKRAWCFKLHSSSSADN